MRKRVFLSIFLCAAVTLLLTAAFTELFLYRSASESLQSEVREEAAYIAAAFDTMETDAREAYIAALGETAANRITRIAADGEVLFDSAASAPQLENHLDRPEVASAIANGTGEDRRQSETLGEYTYYYAMRLSDGSVLRIANTEPNPYGLWRSSFGVLAAVAALVLLLAAVIAWLLTQSIVRPFNEIDLRHPLENHTYAELSPLLSRMEKQNREIDAQMQMLRARREEFEVITSNMQEGLVLVSQDGEVLSANAAAVRILSGTAGGSYLDLCRDKHYISVVESALSGKAKTEKMRRGGRVYTLAATPAQGTLRENAAVLFIVDVTDSELSEKMRREFSANVSHELKTPLTSILGYAEIIGNGLVKAEDIPKFTGRIQKEAARLLTLIEDIIKLSQLDEDELRAEFMPVDLYALCETVVQELTPKAQKAQITLKLAGESALVSGFEPSLFEMVHNLCDNAIAYNRSGGFVHITVQAEDECVRLSVADNGIGIAEEHIGRIFERFYRVDKSHSKETGGTGLGLSIVKHAALLHDAALSVESEPQVGTTVCVVFKKLAAERKE